MDDTNALITASIWSINKAFERLARDMANALSPNPLTPEEVAEQIASSIVRTPQDIEHLFLSVERAIAEINILAGGRGRGIRRRVFARKQS